MNALRVTLLRSARSLSGRALLAAFLILVVLSGLPTSFSHAHTDGARAHDHGELNLAFAAPSDQLPSDDCPAGADVVHVHLTTVAAATVASLTDAPAPIATGALIARGSTTVLPALVRAPPYRPPISAAIAS